MSVQAGVEKSALEVLNVANRLKNVENEIPKIEILRKNVGKVFQMDIADIINTENIREIDENSEEFDKLVESIREHQILQPVLVELVEELNDYKLVLIAGHRRLAAAKKLGLKKILCHLKQFESAHKNSTAIALTENVIRENLHALEIAECYAELHNNNWTIEKIASQFERDKRTIQRYLYMAEWKNETKKLILANKEKFTSVFFRKWYVKSLNEEELEKLHNEALSIINPVVGESVEKKSNEHVELTERYGARVELKDKNGKGSVTISFTNSVQREKILTMLKGNFKD